MHPYREVKVFILSKVRDNVSLHRHIHILTSSSALWMWKEGTPPHNADDHEYHYQWKVSYHVNMTYTP